MTIIRYILLSVSVIYFLLALLIEICALCGVSILEDIGELLILAIPGFIILFFCTAGLSFIEDRIDRKKHKETPPQPEQDKDEKMSFRVIFGGILALNAAFFFLTMDPGKPEFRDGHYVLTMKGRVVEVIDEETYQREINMNPTRQQKAFAAIFLMFTWIVVCGNLDEKKADQIIDESDKKKQ